jgi:hypothetical protein
MVVVEQVAAACDRTPGIQFEVQRVRVVENAVGPGAHVFLVPERGAGEITALHRTLHTGNLRPFLRPEIPYVPHLTVGWAPTVKEAVDIANEWPVGPYAEGACIRGAMSAPHVVEVGAATVLEVAVLRLAAPSAPD